MVACGAMGWRGRSRRAGSRGSCGDGSSGRSGAQSERGEAGEVGGGGEEVEVGVDLWSSADAGSSPAVSTAHEVGELAFDLGSPSSLVRPPPTPSRPAANSRAAVIDSHAPGPTGRDRGEPLQFPGQPSDRSTPRYAEGFFGVRCRIPDAFRGLRRCATDRLPLGTLPHRSGGASRRCRFRFMLRTGQLLAPTTGLRHFASTHDLSIAAGSPLPRTLASPRT